MYVSIRDALVLTDDFSSPLEGLRYLGVEAVELALTPSCELCALDSRVNLPVDTRADAEAYRGRLERMGVRACALLTAHDFSTDDVEAGVALTARAVEWAEALGADTVRVDPAMALERELDFHTRVDRLASALDAVLRRTPHSPVALGIENHGFQGNDPEFLAAVFDRVGSDRLGMTLDSGNFYWRGRPLSEVYAILEALAPYTKHTHLKNIGYPEDRRQSPRDPGWEYGTYVSPLEDGDIDHGRFVRILAQAGYKGDLCIEDESLGRFPTGEERVAVLRRDVRYVKGLLESLEPE